MDLLHNPFHILAASPRDNRRRIVELADERSLQSDSSKCIQACSDLTNPMKRLSAEVAWLPGIGPKRANEVISTLQSTPSNLLGIDKLTSISRANMLAAGILRLSDYTPEYIAEWILEIARAFEGVNPEELCVIINDERVVSGFPEVKNISALEEAIQERRHHYRKVIKSSLDNLSARDIIEVITVAVESATDNGEEQGPILIADLVDSFEVEAQAFLEKEEENITILIDKLRTAISDEQPDSVLSILVNKLILVIKNWDTVAQPIQVSTKSRGLDHIASHRIAGSVRDLSLHLFNEHGKLELSQQLTHMLHELFAEVGEVAERTAEDVDALNKIAEQRTRLIEDAKNRTAEWCNEITYEADVGTIFKKRLRISPQGIDWNGRHWDLDSIIRVRWGGTRDSYNHITYSIVFGDDTDYAFIELKSETIYTNFISPLWKSVGVRLLTDYLNGLRNGEEYRFGSAVIRDHGIELVRRKLFSVNDRVFCRWHELVIWNGPGTFCIGKKEEDDEKVSVTLPYQDEDNIHVLEAAIRMFWKRGGDRLSSLLGE